MDESLLILDPDFHKRASNHVVSNKFIYDDAGKTCAATLPLITPNNKNSSVQKLENQRKNVILMGDILQDANMCNNSDHETVLRIGFLNEFEDEAKLNRYLEKFDLVIADDGSLCPVMSILNSLDEETAA